MEYSDTDGLKKETFHVEHKIWLEKNGAIFGDGLLKLLSNVAALGSITQAARVMDMSYRAAWGKIKVAEKYWGVPLVITRKGGESGGGAKLTPEAVDLSKRFQKLRQKVEYFVRNSFIEILEDWPEPLNGHHKKTRYDK